MSSREAKTFLLKPSSYVNIQLPRYFNFSSVIKKADDLLDSHSLIELSTSKTALSQTTDVNYTLLMNKDGRYDWRPLSIVHPVPYVDLVNSITSHWSTIINRFSEFQNDERIQCISVPVESVGKKSDKAETILNWWQNLEQASIRYALIYKYCIKTDVTNCYGSIYTHSIIIAQSPRTVPVGIAILGKLLELIEDPNEITIVIDNVINQIEDIPNIGFIEIWLQRLSLCGDESKNYSDPLCQKVYLNNNDIWNSTWLKDPFSEDSIINREYIQKMRLAIPQKEIDLFNEYPF